MTTNKGGIRVIIMPSLDHLIIRKSKMAAPTGKLKFAYETISSMEAKIKHKDDQITYLWSLLDDISTAGDMLKPEHTKYFQYVNRKCEERSSVANSIDGQTLTIDEIK